MPEADTALLADAARAAGEIATRYFKRDVQIWDKPGSQGPVTQADLDVDTMLRETLLSARPDYGWLSEETPDDTARLAAARVFVIDPIDGTRAFIEGNPTWSHSLAVCENGDVIAAAVFLPIHEKLYLATRGGGATLNGRPITASDRADLTDAEVLAARPAMDPEHWRNGEIPEVKRQFRSSLAYRMALAAEGRKDAMLTLRATWEWDIAAGTLLVSEAGGRVTDRKGRNLRFNNDPPMLDGVVAGGRHVQEKLCAQLA